ncbi:MAG: hypothetical protein U0556_19050 [Dehalococcoidia bacterium]
MGLRELGAVYSRAVLGALMVAGLAGLLIWLSAAGKPIYTDEVAFFRDFRLVARGDFAGLQIPHPPLYTALGGIAVTFFDEGPLALRLPGLLGFWAAVLMVPPVCLAIAPDIRTSQRAALLALLVFAFHPQVLQGALILDIDNTILPAALLLLVVTVGLSEGWTARRQAVAIGAAFWLLLWTKVLPTPAIAAVCLLAVASLTPSRFRPIVGGLSLGAVAWAASFGLFLVISSGNLTVYLSTVARGSQALRIEQLAGRLAMGGGIQVFWIGLPLVVLGVVAVGETLRRFVLTRDNFVAAWLALLVTVGLIVTTLGNELPMGFPRYQTPLIWLAVPLIASWVARHAWPEDWRFVGLLAAGLAIALWLVVRDPLLPNYQLTMVTDSATQRLLVGARVSLVAMVLPLAIAIAATLVVVGRRPRALVSAVLATSLALWTVTTAAQAVAQYATGYEYGRIGGWEAGMAIASAPSGTIIAPLELVYSSGRDGQFIYDFLDAGGLDRLLERLDREPPAAFAYSVKEERRFPAVFESPALHERLAACYGSPRRIGSYVVYLRSSASIC